MKISSTLRTLAAACAFALASQAGAAVLQVNASGILTGATGVNVGGTLYNVTFADGSCNSVFNGCVQSAFAFDTNANARLAAQSLLDQVFVDGPEGQFDSRPARTFGCLGTICSTYVPYILLPNNVFGFTIAENRGLTTDFVASSNHFRTTDYGTNIPINFAVFELAPPADVPEPASIALFGLALAGLAFTRRRKA